MDKGKSDGLRYIELDMLEWSTKIKLDSNRPVPQRRVSNVKYQLHVGFVLLYRIYGVSLSFSLAHNSISAHGNIGYLTTWGTSSSSDEQYM